MSTVAMMIGNFGQITYIYMDVRPGIGNPGENPAGKWRPARAEADGAFEDLRLEERLHQLVVGTVAKRLSFVADGGCVLRRVVGSLFGQASCKDLLGRPRVHSVRGGLYFKHPVRDILRDALLAVARLAGGAFELAELAAALVNRDDPRLRVELGLRDLVLALTRDLADPPGGAVADDHDLQLARVLTRGRQNNEPRAGLDRDLGADSDLEGAVAARARRRDFVRAKRQR